MKISNVLPCLFLLLGFQLIIAQSPITIESLRELPAVSAPQLSPDEQFLLYIVTRTDIKQDKKRNTLMILDIAQNRKYELIQDASDPKWAPDGQRISFTGTFGPIYGVYAASVIIKKNKISLDVPVLVAAIHRSNHFLGHPTQKNYEWSPNGNYIAFVSADTSSCSSTNSGNDPRVVERLLYKSRTSFSDNCLTKIYLAQPNGKLVKCLTPGSFDSHSLSWSPDSKQIAFISNRTENPDYNYNNDLWTVEIESGNIRRISNSPGTENYPAWSPNGEWIATTSTKRPLNTKDSPAENTSIEAFNLNEASVNRDKSTYGNLFSSESKTANFNRRANQPTWGQVNGQLYFTARNEGKNYIYITEKGKIPSIISKPNHYVRDFHLGKTKLVYAASEADRPTEIYLLNLDDLAVTQLTFEAFSWRANHGFAQLEDFWFDSFDGTKVQGFIAYPNPLPSAPIPVIHRIHGGPHGMYGMGFDEFNQLLVANGYAVVFINPRGSTGYGQEFADGTYQAWGGGDYKDLMIGMDVALDKYNFLDRKRMGVTGGSYGGFMTNWVVTQTDRYKAAVSVASVSNLISFYGNSLYQLLIETEFNGLPWDNYDLLWHFSPMRHIDQVNTPTLLIHGEDDNDVPITQAEEFYIGLMKQNIPTRFVRYPNEGHGVRQPQHREHYYREILNWFNIYLKEASNE